MLWRRMARGHGGVSETVMGFAGQRVLRRHGVYRHWPIQQGRAARRGGPAFCGPDCGRGALGVLLLSVDPPRARGE